MIAIGYIASILIGFSLGLIGGGGSILTVPVLVYLFHLDPVLSTAYSLFIVGSTSLAGGLRFYPKKLIDFQAVWMFGIPSIITVLLTRKYLLPIIPDTLFTIGSFELQKGTFLMLVFALLMIVSAARMIHQNKIEEIAGEKKTNYLFRLIMQGFFVGIVTGLLGAGGGFLIIPALVLLMKIPMKKAVGTSLVIIAINSLSGFIFSLHSIEVNWQLLLTITGIAIVGVLVGIAFSDKVSAASLKKSFGWFVLAMAIYIIIREIFL
ncbi:MAG: sulfite exporter TauE/SafE family protein [Bacteroidetes bacterium]|nr:sulfite exporter TauE/SafE family protein [Bacteroidota bacterium]